MRSSWEVIIVGGSYAGLSAALTLGRSRRSTLVIDDGRPANRFAASAHNILTHDGGAPDELRRLGLADLKAYPTVTTRPGKVVAVTKGSEGFSVQTDDGTTLSAAAVVLATGLSDRLADWPGLVSCWGKSVVHCPYCHAYELRDRPTGYVATPAMATHFAPLLGQWTDDLLIFTADLPKSVVGELRAAGYRTEPRAIHTLLHKEGELQAVVLADGTPISRSALYYHPDFELTVPAIQGEVLALADSGHLAVDLQGRTNVAGVYAAGDCTTPFRSVPIAIAAGNMVGATVNFDLTAAH